METKIIVNGRASVVGGSVTFDEIVKLAGERPSASVTYYWKGAKDITRSGILMPGKSVNTEEGMVFNAIVTGNA